jgi:hypothetical protein
MKRFILLCASGSGNRYMRHAATSARGIGNAPNHADQLRGGFARQHNDRLRWGVGRRSHT